MQEATPQPPTALLAASGTMPLTTGAPSAEAREVVRQALDRLPDADVRHTVELLTCELVTNAERHASGASVVLTLSTPRPGILRVEVADGNPTLPSRRSAGPLAEHGRRLQLVEALARRWGAERQAGPGKVVWFEVAV